MWRADATVGNERRRRRRDRGYDRDGGAGPDPRPLHYPLVTTMYAPHGMYAWDFWVVPTEDEYHLFHLQAPRSLRPSERHDHATVGHAVSSDLIDWRYEGTVLKAGARGSWDDRCIWTGSILPYRDRYYFLYTGRNRDEFLIQRIGLAVSDDLYAFEKVAENPVLTADARWYQTARARLNIEDWRDPFLCLIDGRITALITARTAVPDSISTPRLALSYLREYLTLMTPLGLDRWWYPRGPLAGRGCIALASSNDLYQWKVHPPLVAPGTYGMMECPALYEHEKNWYLVFSTMRGWYRRGWARTVGGGETGVHALYASSPWGPYRPVNGDGVVLGGVSRCYESRLVARRSDDASAARSFGEGADPLALSWLLSEPGECGFGGRISAPQSVRFAPGRLAIESPFGRKAEIEKK